MQGGSHTFQGGSHELQEGGLMNCREGLMNCRESLMNCSIQIKASIHFPDFRFSVRIFFLYLVTNLWF